MHFEKKINTNSRKAMTDYLKNHFRYHTMNSWNGMTSYAHNVKIYNLPLTTQEKEKVYELMEHPAFYEVIYDRLADFNEKGFEAGFNGRSNGYLVLYPRESWELDKHANYSEWTMEELRERVRLLQRFARLADDIIEEVRWMANNMELVEEEIQVTKKVKVLKEKT